MKAGIYFSGSSPLLILTSYDSLTDPKLIDKLQAKGVQKFIAYEVPIDQVKEKYGHHYNVVLNDLNQEDDLRVMDYDGHRVFRTFSLKECDGPIYYED